MRPHRAERIAGQPIKTIRDLVRRIGCDEWRESGVIELLGGRAAEGKRILAELIAGQIIEQSPPDVSDTERYCRCGPAGRRLRTKHLLAPIAWAKADILVAQLMQRVAEANTNPHFLYHVSEVRVFGSYLEHRPVVSDVDLALATEPKRHGRPDFIQRLLERAEQSGKRLSSYFGRLTYA
jgi:hypothetical protein